MKFPLFGLGLLLVFFPIQSKAQTGPAVVDCKGSRLTGAQQVTCGDPSLMKLAAELDNLTRRLESSLTGNNRAALLDTEGPFVVQRNNCQNEPRVKVVSSAF
ncbi:MAG TPA: hypothetical protein VFO86_01385 [Terriglobia bacterium]|nr:hypothetical protein [Terriglobia bacterium]